MDRPGVRGHGPTDRVAAGVAGPDTAGEAGIHRRRTGGNAGVSGRRQARLEPRPAGAGLARGLTAGLPLLSASRSVKSVIWTTGPAVCHWVPADASGHRRASAVNARWITVRRNRSVSRKT